MLGTMLVLYSLVGVGLDAWYNNDFRSPAWVFFWPWALVHNGVSNIRFRRDNH